MAATALYQWLACDHCHGSTEHSLADTRNRQARCQQCGRLRRWPETEAPEAPSCNVCGATEGDLAAPGDGRWYCEDRRACDARRKPLADATAPTLPAPAKGNGVVRELPGFAWVGDEARHATGARVARASGRWWWHDQEGKGPGSSFASPAEAAAAALGYGIVDDPDDECIWRWRVTAGLTPPLPSFHTAELAALDALEHAEHSRAQAAEPPRWPPGFAPCDNWPTCTHCEARLARMTAAQRVRRDGEPALRPGWRLVPEAEWPEDHARSHGPWKLAALYEHESGHRVVEVASLDGGPTTFSHSTEPGAFWGLYSARGHGGRTLDAAMQAAEALAATEAPQCKACGVLAVDEKLHVSGAGLACVDTDACADRCDAWDGEPAAEAGVGEVSDEDGAAYFLGGWTISAHQRDLCVAALVDLLATVRRQERERADAERDALKAKLDAARSLSEIRMRSASRYHEAVSDVLTRAEWITVADLDHGTLCMELLSWFDSLPDLAKVRDERDALKARVGELERQHGCATRTLVHLMEERDAARADLAEAQAQIANALRRADATDAEREREIERVAEDIHDRLAITDSDITSDDQVRVLAEALRSFALCVRGELGMRWVEELRAEREAQTAEQQAAARKLVAAVDRARATARTSWKSADVPKEDWSAVIAARLAMPEPAGTEQEGGGDGE